MLNYMTIPLTLYRINKNKYNNLKITIMKKKLYLIMNAIAMMVGLVGLVKTLGDDASLAFKFGILFVVAVANLLHGYGK